MYVAKESDRLNAGFYTLLFLLMIIIEYLSRHCIIFLLSMYPNVHFNHPLTSLLGFFWDFNITPTFFLHFFATNSPIFLFLLSFKLIATFSTNCYCIIYVFLPSFKNLVGYGKISVWQPVIQFETTVPLTE